MSIIDMNMDKLLALCGKHNVDSLFVFGSVLNTRFGKSSDIDFIVNFKDVSIYDYADNYFSLKSALEALFKKKIDLLEDSAIKNPYLRESIDSSKQLVYG
jgi:uncharacterized protein